jgi:hypothetical protein
MWSPSPLTKLASTQPPLPAASNTSTAKTSFSGISSLRTSSLETMATSNLRTSVSLSSWLKAEPLPSVEPLNTLLLRSF